MFSREPITDKINWNCGEGHKNRRRGQNAENKRFSINFEHFTLLEPQNIICTSLWDTLSKINISDLLSKNNMGIDFPCISFFRIAENKSISLILSIFILLSPQNIIRTPLWDPLSKTKKLFQILLEIKHLILVQYVYPFESHSVIWTPIYKTKLGRVSPHILAFT